MNWDSVSLAVEHTFEWTWKTSLYASVLIVLVLAIQVALGKRLPVRLRYALGLLVLLRLMVPDVPASSFSLYCLGRDFAAHFIQKEVRSAAEIQALSPQLANLPATLPTAPTSSALASPTRLSPLASVIWLAGLVISLLIIWRRHHKFSRWINSQAVFEDGRVKNLLNECRPIMRVHCEVGVVRAPQPATPALFGWRRPRLLLPEGLCEKLEDCELRMILLHELTHVKRADILLNWVIICVRSLHWFNPLVWLALRRRRADRELVCDAMVMSRLGATERRAYGNTLIKLLEDFSGAGFCPSLTPVINHRHEIKRRVIMIAKFKPTGRVAVFASAALVVALCAFTFTGAADKTTSRKKGEAATPDPYFVQTEQGRATRIQSLKNKLEELEQRINQTQKELDELRRKLRVPSLAASGKVEGRFEPETVRQLEASRIQVESNYRRLSELLAKLKELKAEGSDKLRKAMLTANYDPQLGKLFEDLWTTEATLAKLKQTIGPDHPEFMSVSAMRDDLNKKVNERIEGMLSGLQVQAAAAKVQLESIVAAADEARMARMRDAELTATYRPYFEARRDLESLRRVRDALYLKILEQEYGVEVLKAKSQDE